jgi:hypothetical protein
LLKRDRFQFSTAFCVYKFCGRKNLDSFASENLFNLNPGITVKFLQNMFAALDERDFDAKPREKLRKLARNRATAKDDERLRQFFQRECVVARDVAGFEKRGQRRWRNAGAGGDDKMLRGETL